MDKKDKIVDIRQIAISEKVKRLLFDFTKVEFSKVLKIETKTLNSRLLTHDWKYREVLIIKDLSFEKSKI